MPVKHQLDGEDVSMKTRQWIFIVVLVVIALLLSSAKVFSDSPIWQDEFDGSLDKSWSWVLEDTEMWSLEEPGFLRIYTSSTATFEGNLLLRPVTTENFVIETRVMFEPDTNFQFAGLVIYQDDTNFLQFGRAYCDVPDVCVGNGIYFDKIIDGELVDGNFSISVDSLSEAYLRLERRDGMVKAFFSEEGTRWFEIRTHWIPDEFEVSGVGLVASQNFDPDVSPIAADFDYFELTEGGGFLPEGFHDYHEGDVPQWACQAGGWATDPDDPMVKSQVEIVADGVTIATVPADQYREDLLKADVCEGGYCAFEISLWDLISTYEIHNITANAQDTSTSEWVQLSASPKDISCRTYDIYIFDTQTGQAKQLTSLTDTWEFNPRWSPNGKQIVHDRWLMDFASGEHENFGIHITDVATGESTQLLGGEHGNYPAWSPNGQWIAFSQEGVGIYVVPAAGGDPRLVVEDGYQPGWSPNSRRLAYQSANEILTIDIQSKGEAIRVATGEAAAWSPNGQWIAYTMDGDLWKVRVDQLGKPLGDPIQLTFDPGWEGRASWSQDSKIIVFHADYGEDIDIWTIPAIGGFVTRLTGGEYFDDYDPNYSNNGRYVAYASYTPNVQTYTPLPRIVASAVGDWFWTTDFRQGTIYISIYDSQEPDKALLWQGEKDTDGSGFAMIEPGDHELDLVPGNLVVVADRVTTKALVLEDITMTIFDTENDYLAGFAPPHTRVWVAAGPQEWQEGISVRSDGKTGEWEADFASVGFDIIEDMRPWSYAQIFDEDGDANEAAPPPLMQLRINYGHDWVESFYEAGHWVDLTITESNGVTVKATATVLTEPKDFWGGESGFQIQWDPADVDLLPNNWVYAVVDNGVTAQVQLGDIQGEVTVLGQVYGVNDNVTGTILAPWITSPVTVECLDWGSGMEEPFNKDAGMILTDGSASYLCEWDRETEWDLEPWQEIGVAYSTPDGHWVANAFHAEHWMGTWIFDLSDGLPENEYSYHFDWEYSIPEQGETGRSPALNELPLIVSTSAETYEGYVLVGPWPEMSPRAWTGSSCEVVSEILPEQPIRIIWGWVNDYSMNYEEALAHFNSFGVDVSWDGGSTSSGTLQRVDELPEFYNREARFDYICGFTEHPEQP
jgi:regulation of enolase protein 1 (concanavalin A-like superfamily)